MAIAVTFFAPPIPPTIYDIKPPLNHPSKAIHRFIDHNDSIRPQRYSPACETMIAQYYYVARKIGRVNEEVWFVPKLIQQKIQSRSVEKNLPK